MKKTIAILLTIVMLLSLSAAAFAEEAKAPLIIAEQGYFSAGGTVTEPVEGEYDPTQNWLDVTRAGNTAHVDHANVFYQIPAEETGAPIVYLHGYGQSRMGWMTTPDGRDGWATMFLRDGHAAYLVDQPRRGEAGAAVSMTADGFLDAWAEDSKDYKPGDQAWYTHFRIGRVAPERYEGSQFPEGDAAQDQFFRQMTPNTGSFDQAVAAEAMGEVLKEAAARSGQKAVFITHSQGGAVGWDVAVENIAAIVAIEPGGASFRFREIAQAASAFRRGKITVGRSPASTVTVISLGDEKITLEVPNEEFKTIDEPTGEHTVFAAGDLLSVMMDVIHAQSYDYATRRSLCGVNFEVGTDMKLRAIATNGRCLAVSARQISCAELKKPEFSVFLPHAACDFLLHACRGEKTTIVKFDKEDRIGIENGGSVGYFYGSHNSFPDWRKCVPDTPSLIAKFDAVKVENALERAVLALGRKEEIQPDERL